MGVFQQDGDGALSVQSSARELPPVFKSNFRLKVRHVHAHTHIQYTHTHARAVHYIVALPHSH